MIEKSFKHAKIIINNDNLLNNEIFVESKDIKSKLEQIFKNMTD